MIQPSTDASGAAALVFAAIQESAASCGWLAVSVICGCLVGSPVALSGAREPPQLLVMAPIASAPAVQGVSARYVLWWRQIMWPTYEGVVVPQLACFDAGALVSTISAAAAHGSGSLVDPARATPTRARA